MLPGQILEAIEREKLYTFKAQNPLHVVKSQLRRHSRELNFPSSRAVKYFCMVGDGRFAVLKRPVRVLASLFKVPAKSRGAAAGVVSVPTDSEEREQTVSEQIGPSHSEIQWRLLDLGAQMGLSVWAPRGDRGRVWDGKLLGRVPKILASLPMQLDKPTMTTIENIDVLWLDRNVIVAGFEVEHTSQIYSGLLRMADLVTMAPNLEIRLYLVAPDDRLGKFAREVARPTFSSLRKPLHRLCRFLPYTSLLERLQEAKNLVQHLKPEFLDDIAERYDPAAEL